MPNSQSNEGRDRIAARVAVAVAEKPITVHALIAIADALDVPVERLLIGASDE